MWFQRTRVMRHLHIWYILSCVTLEAGLGWNGTSIISRRLSKSALYKYKNVILDWIADRNRAWTSLIADEIPGSINCRFAMYTQAMSWHTTPSDADLWVVDHGCSSTYMVWYQQQPHSHEYVGRVTYSDTCNEYRQEYHLPRWDWQIWSTGSVIMQLQTNASKTLLHLNFNHMHPKASTLPCISKPVSHILTSLRNITYTLFIATGDWHIHSDWLCITICVLESVLHVIFNHMPANAAAMP